ncbi:SusD/RagB family nutrient-binding outer membrane lipoprotein [Parabacteroides sp. OttesenSCG-928-G21]|nr:SusD/RagB family nutrient-binding outer membrane lipoprotein [Parabacteroides sp. OttesenSCG-928-G21]
MKRYITSILAFVFAVWASGCTDNFKEYNTDLSGITEEQMQIDYNHLRIPLDVIQQGIYFNYDFGKGKNWPFQIMQNLNADMFSGYMMDYKPHNGGSHNSDYNLQEGWNGSNWLYTFSYTMPQLKKSEDSTRVNYPILHAITKVLKVEAMHRLADIYGPIIYSNFGHEGGDYHPDTLEEVYYAFFQDLDTAAELFDSNMDREAEIALIPKFDVLLDGQLISWRKFVNSLRMRLAVRIAMAAPAKAQSEFMKAMEHPAGVFEEAHEMVAVSTKKGYSNPLGEINIVWNEAQMNASMESILNGYEDPRSSLFFEPCAEDAIYTNSEGKTVTVPLKGTFKGIRQGAMFTNLLYAGHSKPYVSQSSSAILMTAAEVWFLRAEAALRGWTGEGAEFCYRQGVATSFRQWSVTSSVEEYLESDNIGADYIDAFDPASNIEARCKVSPRWIESASNEVKLEKIITQKWLAIFPEGCEAWTEQRRTGYPRLFPVRFNNSRNGIIDTEIMIRRLNFPAELADTDPQQYQALTAALGGPDHAGTRLWWDTGRNF